MKVSFLGQSQEIIPDETTYQWLCEQYAPLLWGLILLANLPVSHSEPILVRTLASAWQRRQEQPIGGAHYLSQLLGMAHQEGLPFERVQAILFTLLAVDAEHFS